MFKQATRSLLGSAAAAVDRAVSLAAYAQTASQRRGSAESLDHAQRLQALARLREIYAPFGDDHLFRSARPIAPEWQRHRELHDGGEIVDLRWDSAHDTLLPDISDRYHALADNRRAAARLWLHPEPRPVVVLVHGYLGGHHRFEERAWPTSWLYRIGLDLALFVLPFHGLRGRSHRGPPPFPGSDPRMTIEGFRQALGDLRDLDGSLLARGHPAVGVMGMSLGGYTTALAATVDPDLAFAVPFIPLASIADFARDQGRLGRTPEEEAQQHFALECVYRPVSPVHRAPKLPPERLLVVAAEHDRITPIAHAERLAQHFDAPLERWHGGHLLQLWRTSAFRRVGRFLGDLGLLPPR
jgi:pimeloyl-ACP methyl ester carboxylesterase